jgi:hypothetical protein
MLEVSSPGVDRPLTRLKDFEAYEGFEARIELDRLAENRKRFKGRLAGVDGKSVGIDMDGEDETALVPFAWIIEAKLVITDALMKRGADARAARVAAEAAAPAPPPRLRTAESERAEGVAEAAKPAKPKTRGLKPPAARGTRPVSPRGGRDKKMRN